MRRITPINTAAVHASAQQQPTIGTNTRQGHHQGLQFHQWLMTPMHKKGVCVCEAFLWSCLCLC